MIPKLKCLGTFFLQTNEELYEVWRLLDCRHAYKYFMEKIILPGRGRGVAIQSLVKNRKKSCKHWLGWRSNGGHARYLPHMSRLAPYDSSNWFSNGHVSLYGKGSLETRKNALSFTYTYMTWHASQLKQVYSSNSFMKILKHLKASLTWWNGSLLSCENWCSNYEERNWPV